MLTLGVVAYYVCSICFLLSLVYFYTMFNFLDKKSRENKSNNILTVSAGVLAGCTLLIADATQNCYNLMTDVTGIVLILLCLCKFTPLSKTATLVKDQ